MVLQQLIVCMVSSTTLIASGMTIGFSGIAIPQLQNGPDQLTQDEVSWFASISSIATIFGCLTCGPLLEGLGRKRTLLVINIPFIIGWVAHFMTPTPAPIYMLYIARMLNGIGGGMASVPATMYCAEILSDTLRSTLITWPTIAISMGILTVYFLGWLIQESWRLVAGISAIFPVLAAILVFVFLSESPTWLLRKGRLSEAENSFKRIRNIKRDEEMPQSIQKEYDALVRFVNNKSSKPDIPYGDRNINSSEITDNCHQYKTSNEQSESYCKTCNNLQRFVSSMTAPDTWKPLVILNIYFFFMQFSGIPVIIYYSVDIMNSAGISMDPYLAVVILGVVKLVTGIAANFALHRFGRRPMSLLSGILMTVAMVGLGLYLQMVWMNKQTEMYSADLSWIPLTLILFYIAVVSFGFNMIPWALTGELFPVQTKGFAASLSTCFAYLFNFASVKMYPVILEAFNGDNFNKSSGVFYIYGAISLIATLFIILFLPETFNKPLDEINNEFKNRRDCKFKLCSNHIF